MLSQDERTEGRIRNRYSHVAFSYPRQSLCLGFGNYLRARVLDGAAVRRAVA